MNWKTATIIVRCIFIAIVIFAAAKQAGCEEPEKSTLYKAMGVALVGSAAGDILSTELALRRADVREFNPLMSGGPEVRVAAKMAATGLVYVGTDHLHSKGHTRMALWLRVVTVAAWGAVTAHNLRAGR